MGEHFGCMSSHKSAGFFFSCFIMERTLCSSHTIVKAEHLFKTVAGKKNSQKIYSNQLSHRNTRSCYQHFNYVLILLIENMKCLLPEVSLDLKVMYLPQWTIQNGETATKNGKVYLQHITPGLFDQEELPVPTGWYSSKMHFCFLICHKSKGFENFN